MLQLATERGAVVRGYAPQGSRRVQIVDGELHHARELAAKLRPMDRAETAALGFKPYAMLRRCVRGSLYCRAAYVDGEIAAMFGLGGEALGEVGQPWLLTAPAIERIPVAFLQEGRRAIDEMLAFKPQLENHVLAAYSGALRLIEMLGFALDPPAPYGPRGALFRRFHLRREDAEARAQQHPVRRPGSSFAPFIVYTAGRSRTAWLSAFLSYGACTCHNEVAVRFRSLADVAAFFEHRGTGSAETAVVPGWMLIEHVVPGIRSVVVRRPVDDIVASFARSQVAAIATIDEDKLRKVIAYEERCLERVSAEPGVLTVDFDDLDKAETCAAVFEHCLPYRFDRGWWDLMSAKNVQSDVASLFRYYQDNHDAIEQFKRHCKAEMIKLVRAGSLRSRSGAGRERSA